MSRRAAVAFGLTICAFLTFIGAVVAFGKNTGQVALENQTSEPIGFATVSVCGQRLEFSDVESGKIEAAAFSVGADSHYDVVVVFRSGRRIVSSVGYVTSGIDYRDTLIVRDNEIVLKSVTISDR